MFSIRVLQPGLNRPSAFHLILFHYYEYSRNQLNVTLFLFLNIIKTCFIPFKTFKYRVSLLSVEVTSTLTRPVENVITSKGLQDRSIHILHGTTVENKGKTIN